MQRTSHHGLELIKQHEGLRLNAYMDPVGVWTIGWGHTRNVREGDRISKGEAEAFFMVDIAEAEECVRRRVTVPLTQGQFDALVSFVFNLGCGSLIRSSLLRKLNHYDYPGAACQFPRWINAGGKVLRGLETRRAAERELFVREEEAHEEV
jgi:lysozyme